MHTKVLEARPPPGPEPIGGCVRLQANALTAADAISPRLRVALEDACAVAHQVMLHDCAGAVGAI